MGVFPDTNYNLSHRDVPRLSYISSFLRKQEPTAGPGAVVSPTGGGYLILKCPTPLMSF